MGVGPPDVELGVTELEAADAAPDPAQLLAVTVNVYAVPFVRPPTVAFSAAPPTLADWPPGDAVTVYPLTAAPPFEDGALQLTVACPFPATADAPVGAPGTVAGTTWLEAAE